MRSGELRHRIELQTNTPVANAIDELVDTYTTFATVWGAIEPLSGNRLFLAQQADSQIQGVVRIRYRKDVVPTMRIKFGSRYLQIISIIDREERHQELQVMYKEKLD